MAHSARGPIAMLCWLKGSDGQGIRLKDDVDQTEAESKVQDKLMGAGVGESICRLRHCESCGQLAADWFCRRSVTLGSLGSTVNCRWLARQLSALLRDCPSRMPKSQRPMANEWASTLRNNP